VSRAAPAVVLALMVLVPVVVHATWTPQADEWAGYRHDGGHGGAVAPTSLFLAGPGGVAKVKWSREVPHAVLYPPSVADLDRNGVKEIVVTPTDVRTAVGPPPDISFLHKVTVLNGATGTTAWTVDEPNSFALLFGANAGNVDLDGQAEVVYFAGNPLTGTSATNRLVARTHAGAEQWRFSDAVAWGSTQRPIGVLTAPQTADVDDDGRAEAVFGVTLADVTVSTVPAGPDCPNPNANKLRIEAANLRYFVHAVNGETGTPSSAWVRQVQPGALASTPALVDLNGDGRRDAVWGSGIPSGVLIPSCSAEVAVDASAEDNRVLAFSGAAPFSALWTFTFHDPPGVPRPLPATPVVAGTTAGGDPVLVFQVPVPPGAPASHDPDRTILLALNGRTGAQLWRQDLRPAGVAPPAAADLDGDGQPEIVVQLANRLLAFRNDGTDFWTQGSGPSRGITFARTLTSHGVAIGDIDSDGVPDVLTVLAGNRAPAPMAELLAVRGDTGATKWTVPLVQDVVLGGPILADVDGDDDLLEIIVGTGYFTLGESQARTGRVLVLEPNAPDLTVTDVQLLGDRVRGNPQTVRATVNNPGTRDASAVPVRLLVDGAAVGPDASADVAAGGTAVIDFPWTPAASGAHSLRVVADAPNAVRELSETNNDRSLGVTILKRYDLAVASADITFDPAQPVQGATVTVTARVRNVGEAALPGPALVRVSEAGAGWSEDRQVPALAPGAFADVSVPFVADEERTYTVRFEADPEGALVEEREDNNEAVRSVAVGADVTAPDVVAVGLQASHGIADVGDTVALSATFRNDGTKAVDPFVVAFFDGDAPLAMVPAPGLAVGASAQVPFDWVATAPRDRHTLRAVATAPGEVVVANNEAAVTIVVGRLHVEVAMEEAAYAMDDEVRGYALVRFADVLAPVPDVPVRVDVYLRTESGAVVQLHRARIDGVTDAAGLLPFRVPKAVLGDITVCFNGQCVVEHGDPLGMGVHAPGAYRVHAAADRHGFLFEAETRYEVAGP
jgi:hypothetical protein